MAVAIEFKNIKKEYGEKIILENFNLSIEQGEFLTVVGSSGCGKTTLLKMVNGLIIPDKGQVLVHGKCTQEVNLIELRRNIGYAIQGSVLFPHMTVEENISYVPNLWNKRDKNKTKIAVKKWMKIVRLDEELLKGYPNELSGGQQQRVGIARALAASPDILLMDEPFGAVDEITRSSLQDEIIRIQKEANITIIFITHDIRDALKLGSKVLVMDKGNIQQLGTPDEILKSPANKFVEKLIEREVSYINQ